jgi:hypothetical protein
VSLVLPEAEVEALRALLLLAQEAVARCYTEPGSPDPVRSARDALRLATEALSPPAPPPWAGFTEKEIRENVQSLLADGYYISAVRHAKACLGLSLAEAKAFVDRELAALPHPEPGERHG